MSRAARKMFDGPVGLIEVLLDKPMAAPRGVAVIAHPHPKLGGTAEHKVPAILATSLREQGWLAVRPSFRGTGNSEGVHDDGDGETDDLMQIAVRFRSDYPDVPLALVGFSFGAYVQTRVAKRLASSGLPAQCLVLTGPGVGDTAGGRHYAPDNVQRTTLIVHGEFDAHVPLQNVLAWSDSQALPVTVIPAADHYFSRRLPLLSKVVCDFLAASTDGPRTPRQP